MDCSVVDRGGDLEMSCRTLTYLLRALHFGDDPRSQTVCSHRSNDIVHALSAQQNACRRSPIKRAPQLMLRLRRPIDSLSNALNTQG
jgi:hypothetical protein